MHLPQVQVVGVHVAQGFVEVSQCTTLVAGVGLAGKKDLAPPFPQRFSVVRLAPVIGTCRFTVSNAEVEGTVDKVIRLPIIAAASEYPFPAQAEHGHIHTGTAQLLSWNVHA